MQAAWPAKFLKSFWMKSKVIMSVKQKNILTAVLLASVAITIYVLAVLKAVNR